MIDSIPLPPWRWKRGRSICLFSETVEYPPTAQLYLKFHPAQRKIPANQYQLYARRLYCLKKKSLKYPNKTRRAIDLTVPDRIPHRASNSLQGDFSSSHS